MGIFDSIGSAKARMDSNYLIPSHTLARIDKCKIGESRKGEGFMVIEMTVIHDCEPDNYSAGSYGHRPGEEVSHMMMAKHDSFLGNVKAFVAAALGMENADDVTEEAAEAICGDDQPLAGTVVEVVGRHTTTKAGNPFTVVNYKGEVPIEAVPEAARKRFFPEVAA